MEYKSIASMNPGPLLKRFFRQLLLAVILFEVVVIGGIALFIGVGMIVGYLPYSDRPGPGWYGPSQTVQSLPIVWEWLSLNPWAPPIYGAVIFMLVKVVSIIPRLPRIVIRVTGALLTAAVAVLWVLATGWYFSLSLSVQWAALVFGIAYGTWVLPRILRGHLQAAQQASGADR